MAIKDGQIVIGIDSSTSCTGISVIQVVKNKEKLLYYSKIIPNHDHSYEQKSNEILDGIFKVYDEYLKSAPIVAIEILNSHKNMNTTRILAGLWGFILSSFFRMYGKNIISLNTSSVKKKTTGDGNADKKKMIKYVNKYFGLDLKYHDKNKDISDDDIADAIGVALSMIRTLREEEEVDKL